MVNGIGIQCLLWHPSLDLSVRAATGGRGYGCSPDCNRINVWSQRGAETNPVFNFFREVFLGPFSEEDTRLMLSDIARLMGKSFDDETLRGIIGKREGTLFLHAN